ncbi:MAG: NAD-dependent epimerase/dehydratase family protein [Candidatus Koribacter versatilis]|uniref:NAD-dependent epimerase/dehydratase family protein n=1 Tax=Candidatus Korobacter versatilis TaxID=658062 RepID=A0A932A8S5_9BACT|nr:NAD-dependent epimerase/dehydratase family protein [Candidatus Koribacter versatilis]
MAESGKPRVLVTGVAGNLGLRLLPELRDFDVVGVDMHAPAVALHDFRAIDLGDESSCPRLVELLRDTRASAVIHLAFVIDPVRTGVLDVPRMWQINVAGTARVMEAIAEVNRMGGGIARFIFPSSVSAYGPDLPRAVDEQYPLGAHTLPYAIHKREADVVVQARAPRLGACSTYLLRPHIFVGASMQNYLVGALRGTPSGRGRIAERWRAKGRRLPLLLPFGKQYPEARFQFLHVDDMARLVAWLLHHVEERRGLNILNVAGRGAPVTIARAAAIAGSKTVRLPGRALCRAVLRLLWQMGISGIPPEALPYMLGTYLMDCSRLEQMLGADYTRVMRFTVEDALRDTFGAAAETPVSANELQQTVAR